MIFVTVGTHEQGFERLIKAVDNLIGKGKIKDKIIMQIGNTKYKPKNCKWKRFLSPKKFIQINKKAKIIITHGGEGCIISALKFNKPSIVVPRYKKFNEHINDHQLDLTKTLEKEEKIIAVYDIKNLEMAIKKAKTIKIKGEKKETKMIKIIRDHLEK